MADSHAQRSLVVYKIWMHRRGKPDEVLDFSSVCAAGIHHVFKDFVDANKSVAQVKGTPKHILFTGWEEFDNGIVAKYASGTSGERITMVDPDSEKILDEFSSDKAPMVDSRVYLKGGFSDKYALACIEHVQGSAGDTVIFGPLRDHIASLENKPVLKWEAVTEAEAIDHFIGVESIEVKRYLKQRDLSDSLISGAKCITTTLTHKRGRRFSLSAFSAALADRQKAVSLFGLMPLDNLDEYSRTEVFFKLKGKDGKEHRFCLDDRLDVKIREVLNEKGTPPLSDDEFVANCDSRCEEIELRLGRPL